MKPKNKSRSKKTAVVPSMIFGLGAALSPMVPGCRSGESAAGGASDSSVRDMAVGDLTAIPDHGFPIDVTMRADQSVGDLTAIPDHGFPIDVMVPRDMTRPLDFSAAVADGGSDGPGGDR